MHDLTALAQRLKKNMKKMKPWAEAWQTNAFRVYHADIPELRYYIDLYAEHAVVYSVFHKESPHSDAEIIEVLHDSLGISPSMVHLKRRQKIKNRSDQYERKSKGAAPSVMIEIYEESSRYLVNLSDYLDTGLFLDHRPLRRMMRKLSAPQKLRVLNLFSYTGSISVAAAQAGAHVTSVDLSGTYLSWAQENFRLNGINPDGHDFFEMSIGDYLDGVQKSQLLPDDAGKFFDVIVIDPPTFSNSKKAGSSFDVQRDHRSLIENASKLLKKGGTLWFSTNFTKFSLDPKIPENFMCQEWTAKTVPPDFSSRPPIHRSFRISRRDG